MPTEAILIALAHKLHISESTAKKIVDDVKVGKTLSKEGTIADDISESTRPTWRQSENDVAANAGSEARTQISYKDGVEVPSGTKGSVKPDVVVDNIAIEVKNYNIDNATNMINTISQQINQRYNHLSEDMIQKVIIDYRGQNVTKMQKDDIVNKIIAKTNGILKPENIEFK